LIDIELDSANAISSAALPTNIDFDAWPSAVVLLTGGQSHVFLQAEVGVLTPSDMPFIVGDYNGDGLVDAGDLGVWRFANGSINANLAADATGDMHVDGADFLAWQRSATDPRAASFNATVPEPRRQTLAWPALAVCGCAVRRRRYM
jgi:hypothetical protein